MGASKRRLTRAPEQHVRVNLRDEFVAGLNLIQLFAGNGNYDSVTGAPYQLATAGPVQRADGMEFNATNAGLRKPMSAVDRAPSYTVMLLVKKLGPSSPYCAFIGSTYQNNDDPPYGDQIDAGNNGDTNLRFQYNAGGTAAVIDTNASLTTGTFEWLAATFTSSEQRFYKNGVLLGSNNSFGATPYAANATLNLGCHTAIDRNPNLVVGFALRAARVLTVAEMNTIMADRYRLVENPQRRAAVRRIATGPTYLLAAVAGAFGLSLSDAGLAARRRLVSAVGSLVMAGSAAGLKVGRRLSAAPGSFAASYSPGALKATRRLSAAAASFATSGAGANLAAARKLAAESGVFSLTGGAVSFTYTPKPGGQGPTYTLTGGSGTFLLSASAARLLLARRLVAAAGAFSAAGAPVSLLAARRLPATAGTFSIVGAAAGLRATRRLSAAAASFALTGSTATFVYAPIVGPGGPTYTLTAVGGSLGLSGSAAGLRARRRLPGGAAQFAVTGWPANLAYSERIVYARAPAGSGYSSRTVDSTHRPTSAATARPAAIQRNRR